VNKTVTDFGGIYTDIRPPPVTTPLGTGADRHLDSVDYSGADKRDEDAGG